jgi:type IV pilus assembly protein PilC
MHASRQLGAFIQAGIPILTAIGTLADEADKPAVRSVMTALADDVRAGSTLSEAVERHPRDFPAFYRGILRSAELTGRLDVVLDQLSVYLERDLDARRKIRAALTYPALVALMALGTVAILTIVVLPRFEDFFVSLDAELPLATRILLACTDFVGTWWWAGLAAGGALAVVGILGGRTARGRWMWHRTLMSVPVVGECLRYALIERFTRIFASMVAAGVALPESIRVAAESLNNAVFTPALARAREEMITGAGLAQPIAATRLFPGVAAQMIRVGEDTGSLDRQLEVAATFYERELEYKIKKVTAVIEPLITIVMGLLVGFVAVALVSAMYGIFRAAQLS